MITKQDYIDWKSNPVTKAFFQAVNANIERSKDELLTTDLDNLRYRQGYAQALFDILRTEWEDIE